MFAYQILEGLEHLHSLNITHGKLTATNILMQNESNIQLSDFGVKLLQERLKQCSEISFCMAPEIERGRPYTDKVDIWDLGCTVIQMISGKLPNYKQQQFETCRQQRSRISFLKNVSAGLRQFLDLACEENEMERPSACELMAHDLFKGNFIL
ncbi:uncharacterized protein LOC131943295 [Physella acuta]|uniref:uncharacterized protein LOC131943295 n=1 Tax=Physella acuta TaxID=109671 RepID=UPI0027DE7D4C|nr:uncharacterized protein LOC131943295 [Physella acuta]